MTNLNDFKCKRMDTCRIIHRGDILKASFGSGFGCSQFVVALYDLYYLKSLDTYNR